MLTNRQHSNPSLYMYIWSMDNKKKIIGLGGVFLKAKNPNSLCSWYDKHLGTTFGKNSYALFHWQEKEPPHQSGSTTFSFFKEDSNYFHPSVKPVMLNFRVQHLDELLQELRANGVYVLDKVEEYPYGKFAWILDEEGNKVELWEPRNEHLLDEE